ncbi:MAG TPA: hypothetical protein VKD23_19625, partial [Terriglobales bacterium]|nr:hypothetical protein [Terriglobales bacterium]
MKRLTEVHSKITRLPSEGQYLSFVAINRFSLHSEFTFLGPMIDKSERVNVIVPNTVQCLSFPKKGYHGFNLRLDGRPILKNAVEDLFQKFY